MKKFKSMPILLVLSTLLYSNASFASSQAAQHCGNIKVQTLGAGGPEINDGLASSSFLVWVDGKARVMVDAGGGSSLNFEKSSANFNDLQAILFTHLHVDHSAALPVYVKAGFFTGRNKNIDIFGPNSGGSFPSTTSFISALLSNEQKSAYPYLADNLIKQNSTDFLIVPHNVTPNNKVWRQALENDISVSAINVTHGSIPTIAWRIDSGNCSVTFSGDMNGRSGNLPTLAKNTNLLIANNAIPEHAGRIENFLHMTPLMIGNIAKQANAKKLVLAHFMLRSINKTDEAVSIIKKQYKNSIVLANELDYISVD